MTIGVFVFDHNNDVDVRVRKILLGRYIYAPITYCVHI